MNVLASEWLKLRSLRSTTYAVLVTVATVAVGALLAYGWANAWDGMAPERRTNLTEVSIEQLLSPVVQLCFAVVGALAATAEFTSGLIRTSLTVVPRRSRVLAAKAVVVGTLGFVAGTLGILGVHVASRLMLGDRPFPGYAEPLVSRLPGVLGLGASVAVLTLLGLGIGVLLRSTTGAVAVLATLLFVLPMVANFLATPANTGIADLLPGRLAELAPLPAVGVAAAYLLVTLAPATLAMNRRDVR